MFMQFILITYIKVILANRKNYIYAILASSETLATLLVCISAPGRSRLVSSATLARTQYGRPRLLRNIARLNYHMTKFSNTRATLAAESSPPTDELCRLSTAPRDSSPERPDGRRPPVTWGTLSRVGPPLTEVAGTTLRHRPVFERPGFSS